MDFGFNLTRTANASAWRLLPNRWDFVAFPLIICVLALTVVGFHETLAPISTLQTGTYGIRDVCLSVPTVVGRGGVLGHVEIDLWPKERMGLQSSAKVLRETIDKVLK